MVAVAAETPIQFRGAAWDLYCSLIDFKSARRVREILVEGPRGCIAGETEIFDPIHGRGERVDRLCATSKRPWVLTLNGPVLAEVPFIKGVADLYRVALDSGVSCLVTKQHRFLSRSGWKRVCDLVPGMELLSSSLGDARRSKRIGVGSQDRYWTSKDQWSRIASICFERADFFYDLHVPGQEHYLADGIWSHNSGKSRPILQMIAALVENFPNLRVLICSKTRDMLTATILPEWELCWPADHPILSGPQPNSRSVYYHPNKSAVTIGGVMDSDRHYGASWDIVYADEAHKLTLDEWEKFLGTLRNWKLPNQQLIIASTNPKHPKHWLNERANRGLMERYKSKLADNPKWVGADGQRTEQGAAFISNLEKMGGVRLRRDVRGEWCANEGMILEEWEDDIHLVTLNAVEKRGGSHWLHIRGWKKPFEVDNYFVSMDFGYRAAGVLGVWAEDPDGRLIRCASVYHADKQLDWWADRLIELHVKWPFSDGVGDSAEPRTIDFLNDRLRWLRSGDVFIRPAEKTRGKLFGIDQLRWGLSKKDGGPRTYFINEGPIDYKPFPFGKSEKLAEQGHATCFEEEVMGYVWDDFEDPKPGAEKRERPDKGCDDHEIDETIYAHVYAWKRRMKKMGVLNPIFKPGTMGAWLGDDKILGADWNYGQPMVRT